MRPFGPPPGSQTFEQSWACRNPTPPPISTTEGRGFWLPPPICFLNPNLGVGVRFPVRAGRGWSVLKDVGTRARATGPRRGQEQTQAVSGVGGSTRLPTFLGVLGRCTGRGARRDRSQRPVGKGDGNQTSRPDLSHRTHQLRGQHLWPGFLTVCRLPLSLCPEVGGALGAQTDLAKVSVTSIGQQRAGGRLIGGQPRWSLIIIATIC